MGTHNIHFYEEILIIMPELSSNTFLIWFTALAIT